MHHSRRAHSQPDLLRTFIAIELDGAVRDALAATQEQLRRTTPQRAVRWVRPEGIHLTLKFLGDTEVRRLGEIKEALAAAAAEAATFSFDVQGLDCFPNPHRPRVIWVGLKEPTGRLRALWQSIETHVAPLGWPTERRGFQPHLTLGRLRQRVSSAERQAIGRLVERDNVGWLAGMDVSAVSLIKSDLRPSGAVYTILAEAQLGGQR
jgi:2'-5' RNA ligase